MRLPTGNFKKAAKNNGGAFGSGDTSTVQVKGLLTIEHPPRTVTPYG